MPVHLNNIFLSSAPPSSASPNPFLEEYFDHGNHDGNPFLNSDPAQFLHSGNPFLHRGNPFSYTPTSGSAASARHHLATVSPYDGSSFGTLASPVSGNHVVHNSAIALPFTDGTSFDVPIMPSTPLPSMRSVDNVGMAGISSAHAQDYSIDGAAMGTPIPFPFSFRPDAASASQSSNGAVTATATVEERFSNTTADAASNHGPLTPGKTFHLPFRSSLNPTPSPSPSPTKRKRTTTPTPISLSASNLNYAYDADVSSPIDPTSPVHLPASPPASPSPTKKVKTGSASRNEKPKPKQKPKSRQTLKKWTSFHRGEDKVREKRNRGKEWLKRISGSMDTGVKE